MATIQKKFGKKKFGSRKPTIEKLALSLPSEKSRASTNLEDYTWLFYGVRKIGKTSLSSHFKNTIHQMFEPGSKSLEIFERPVPTWDHFVGYVKLLEAGNHKFKNCVIDTGAIAYDRCLEYVCRVNGISHPGEVKDYGASWKKVAQEFERMHTRVVNSGMGLLVIAHAKTEEVESESGKKFSRIVPQLPGGAEQYYNGFVDNIFYYTFIGGKRFLIIRGNDYITAGTRCERNFLTPKGEQIYRIPMGNSSKEAYENLVKAFNNQQTITYKPKEDEYEEVAEAAAASKKKKFSRK